MAAQSSLKEYLKRYESNNDEDINKKKRKKKKVVKPAGPSGVLVVDEDPVWQKPVKLDDDEQEDSTDEERPQVNEDIDVKRMKRLDQLRLRRGYNIIAEDGSGWVSLSPKGEKAGDGNSDFSPPRRQRARYDTPSPEPGGRDPDTGREDEDLSPPRQRSRRHDTSTDIGSGHGGDTYSDFSPRKNWIRNDTPSPDLSMKDDDLSPPRRRKARKDTPSQGPSSDKATARNGTPSPYPPMKDTDSSPSHKQKDQNDLSSLNLSVRENDLSPPRQWRRHCSPPVNHATTRSDLSPPRKNRAGIEKLRLPDLSPPRLARNSSSAVDDGSHKHSDKDISITRKKQKDSFKPMPFKEQPKTGLVCGRDIREEISKTKINDLLRFEQMDPDMSGRGAEPVYRDKKGQRISKEEYFKSKQKVEEKPKEKKLEWGKGLAQKREVEARLQELELEKDKPFARTRDDPDLDKMLKDRLRWGDPMAHLVKKKHSEPILTDLGDNEKMKESGFIVPQEIPAHSWLKRGVDAAPNRYGIKPGRHWDGVDRSNGFEKKMFRRLNEKQATEREAYLWSVSDM